MSPDFFLTSLLPNHQVLHRTLCFSTGGNARIWAHLFCMIVLESLVSLVIWWSPRGQRQGPCSSCFLLYLQHLSPGLAYMEQELHKSLTMNEWMNECCGRRDSPGRMQLSFQSKWSLLLGHLACCTKCPVCLPSCTCKLLEGRGWIITIFLSPDSGSHRHSMMVCGIKDASCVNKLSGF